MFGTRKKSVLLILSLVLVLLPPLVYGLEESNNSPDAPAGTFTAQNDTQPENPVFSQSAIVQTRNPEHLREAIQLMEQGIAQSDRELLKQAEALFRDALLKNPQDAYALAYLGNCQVFRGKLTGFLPTQMLTILKGFKNLEQAKKLWPMNPDILLLSAWRGLDVEIIYGRLWSSADDFATLTEGYKGGEGWVTRDIAQQAYLGLGECLIQLGDIYGARSCWTIALTFNPDNEWGIRAKQWLEDTQG
jgi:tetratricopeptide (TPR) repeat protein